MKKHLHAILWVTFVATCLYIPSRAQSVTIDPKDDNPEALVNASSIKKGFLMLRMTETELTNISTPTAGLQIYCTNCSTGAGPYGNVSHAAYFVDFSVGTQEIDPKSNTYKVRTIRRF